MDKKDFYGTTILSHAVNRQNEDLIDFMIGDEFPKDRGEAFIGDSLLYAIEGRHYGITEKLVNYAEKKRWIDRKYVEVNGTLLRGESVLKTLRHSVNDTEIAPQTNCCFMNKASFGPASSSGCENASVRFSDDMLRNPIIKGKAYSFGLS